MLQIEQGDIAAALDLDRRELGQRDADHRARLVQEMAGPVGLPFTMSPKTTEPTVPWKVMWLLPKRIDTPSRSITSLSPL
ncbi:hypothetical protein [Ralstonia sp. RRA.1]|uniref:hypothetical protein n=1 Tax=Ralstonia sp. RRA TaxID=3122075 RepID=UPI0030D12F0C